MRIARYARELPAVATRTGAMCVLLGKAGSVLDTDHREAWEETAKVGDRLLDLSFLIFLARLAWKINKWVVCRFA